MRLLIQRAEVDAGCLLLVALCGECAVHELDCLAVTGADVGEDFCVGWGFGWVAVEEAVESGLGMGTFCCARVSRARSGGLFRFLLGLL